MTLLEKAKALAEKLGQGIGHDQKYFITVEQLKELIEED